MKYNEFERVLKQFEEELHYIDKEIEEIESSPYAMLFNRIFKCTVINKGQILGTMMVITKECKFKDLVYGMKLYAKSIELVDYYLENPLRIKGLLRAINILTGDYIFISFNRIPFILDDNLRLQYVIDKETNLTVLKKSIYNQPILVRNQSYDAYNIITNPKNFEERTSLIIVKDNRKITLKEVYLLLDENKLYDPYSNELLSLNRFEDRSLYYY